MTSFRLLNTATSPGFFILLSAFLLAACSPQEYIAPATGGDTQVTQTTIDIPAICAAAGSNQQIVISGTSTGAVTEDMDPDANNLLETGGKLAAIDCDAGITGYFTSETLSGSYGDLTIDADGNWHYAADNTQSAIQDMGDGDIFRETFTISSIDGTTHELAITISGADEPVADITLSWNAPTQREDNTALTPSDIAGYRVYIYRTPGELTSSIEINDASAESYTFKNFASGTYYFLITSYDSQGRESQQGAEVQVII